MEDDVDMPPAALDAAIDTYATSLNLAPGIDPTALLKAICDNESNYGVNIAPLCEPSYWSAGLRGHVAKAMGLPQPAAGHGRWFNSAAWKAWGVFSGMSHGPTQIMGVSLWDLGFRGDPCDLGRDAMTAIHWTVVYLNKRCRGCKTVEEIGDAYNSGSQLDRFKPKEYMAKLVRNYERRLSEANRGTV